MTPRDEAEVKREALEEFADWLVNVMGFDGTANLARERSAKLYPPPPKRVRAEVKLEKTGMTAVCLSGGWVSLRVPREGQLTTMHGDDITSLAALVARADKDGMVLEGEMDGLWARCAERAEDLERERQHLATQLAAERQRREEVEHEVAELRPLAHGANEAIMDLEKAVELRKAAEAQLATARADAVREVREKVWALRADRVLQCFDCGDSDSGAFAAQVLDLLDGGTA